MKDSKKIPTDKDLLDLLFSDEKLLVIGDKLFELLRQEKAFAKHKILTYILYEYAIFSQSQYIKTLNYLVEISKFVITL